MKWRNRDRALGSQKGRKLFQIPYAMGLPRQKLDRMLSGHKKPREPSGVSTKLPPNMPVISPGRVTILKSTFGPSC